MSRQKKTPAQSTPSQHPADAPPNAANGLDTAPTPWTILRAAIKAVPLLKYCLAVLGIVSAIAMTKEFGIGYGVAAFGTIVVVILMVVLFVFAAFPKVAGPHVQKAATFMMWCFLLVGFLAAFLLGTSTFFSSAKAAQ